jgi:hypothetical protein
VLEPLGDERSTLRTELEDHAKSLPPNDPQGRWLRWFLADPRTRTISPLSDETVSEYIQRRIDDNTTNSLCEAVDLDPNNALALARLASHLVQDKAAQQVGWEIHANLYSSNAVKLAQQDAEVLRLRKEVLHALQKNPRPGNPAIQP